MNVLSLLRTALFTVVLAGVFELGRWTAAYEFEQAVLLKIAETAVTIDRVIAQHLQADAEARRLYLVERLKNRREVLP